MDHDGYLPVFAHISEGREKELKTLQVWTALIAILLLKYLKMKSRITWALSNLTTLLRWNLFTYRDLWAWIDNPFETLPDALAGHQLELVLDST